MNLKRKNDGRVHERNGKEKTLQLYSNFKNKRKTIKKMKYMEVDGSIKLVQPLWNGCGGFS